ncbi:hypothetical protein HMPREF0663_10407 [Hoylesella oralis ATCC 33269]|uniref:Uncharacterized protein n=1 Tax=Hoylesella oralis ATCC 33269 TaxID=873533 RepID=E7RMQ7_9BACT|nr:hypothetical protein HMPREF0663_10407 [Hoylesella oralis ATCC 33269]
MRVVTILKKYYLRIIPARRRLYILIQIKFFRGYPSFTLIDFLKNKQF